MTDQKEKSRPTMQVQAGRADPTDHTRDLAERIYVARVGQPHHGQTPEGIALDAIADAEAFAEIWTANVKHTEK